MIEIYSKEIRGRLSIYLSNVVSMAKAKVRNSPYPEYDYDYYVYLKDSTWRKIITSEADYYNTFAAINKSLDA